MDIFKFEIRTFNKVLYGQDPWDGILRRDGNVNIWNKADICAVLLFNCSISTLFLPWSKLISGTNVHLSFRKRRWIQ